MRIGALLVATAVAGREVPSQQIPGAASRAARPETDSIGRMFREVLVAVAGASELPRLDSTALLPGVRREIRIYYIGVGQPYTVVRLIQHTHGVDGQFGLFWPVGVWYRSYSSPEEERRSREKDRAFDATVRAWADTAYDCRAVKQSHEMNVCWLAPRPGRVVWAQLLAQLDSVGIDSIPSPVRPKMVTDAWISLVEVRKPLGYRSYRYSIPDSTSADAGERAAARIATVVWEAFRRRIGR